LTRPRIMEDKKSEQSLLARLVRHKETLQRLGDMDARELERIFNTPRVGYTALQILTRPEAALFLAKHHIGGDDWETLSFFFWLRSSMLDDAQYLARFLTATSQMDVKICGEMSEIWRTNTAKWFFSLSPEQQQFLVEEYDKAMNPPPLGNFQEFMRQH
jgi:hypothetical protein